MRWGNGMELLKAPLRYKVGWEQSLMLMGSRVRKGNIFLSLWGLHPSRPLILRVLFLFTWQVMSWKVNLGVLFGFSVCVGSGLKAEESGEGKVFSECKLLWFNTCSEWIMRHTCILILGVEYEWSSAMYKSKGFRMAAWVQCLSEVRTLFLFQLPFWWEYKWQFLVQLLCIENKYSSCVFKREFKQYSAYGYTRMNTPCVLWNLDLRC